MEQIPEQFDAEKFDNEEEAYSFVWHELAFGGLLYKPLKGEELARQIWLAGVEFGKQSTIALEQRKRES